MSTGTEKKWREAADRLWNMPDMQDPKPDEALEEWANEIPYRGQWVVPGVLLRLIKRAREEGLAQTSTALDVRREAP